MEFVVPELSFFVVAVPAVFLTGLDKGGLGSVLGVLGVPLMSLVMSPIQAAAILLPLLLVMDSCAIWGWRKHVNWLIFRTILPGGLLGVLSGFVIFYKLPENTIRFLIGVLAVLFSIRQWLLKSIGQSEPCSKKGMFWATIAGFTSFGVHAGGPPLSVYMLPLRLDKKILTGTMAMFFGIINLLKIPAYGGLGQFGWNNLMMSAMLLPLCPIGVFVGMKLVNIIREDIYYKYLYIALFMTGCKLIFDAIV